MQVEIVKEDAIEIDDALYNPVDNTEAAALSQIMPAGYVWTQRLMDGLRAVRKKYAALHGTKVRFTQGAVDNMRCCAKREASKYYTYLPVGRPAPLSHVEDAIISAYDRYCDTEQTLLARTQKDSETRRLLISLLEEYGAMSDNPVVLREAGLHENIPVAWLKKDVESYVASLKL